MMRLSFFFFFFLTIQATSAATDCPKGYSPWGIISTGVNFCYKIYVTYMDRQQAVAKCAEDQATLATITTEEENRMYLFADTVTDSLTFGLSCYSQGHCVFDDGTPFDNSSYNNFHGGQPVVSNGECVALQTIGSGRQDGRWVNIPCNTLGSFICRYVPDSILTQESGCNRFYIDSLFDGRSAMIVSPHYPKNYNNYQTCSYIVRSFNFAILNITFNDFYVENERDFVRIYSGGYMKAATLLGTYSGQLSPFSVLVNDSEVMVTLTSDDSHTFRGFSATVSYIDQLDNN